MSDIELDRLADIEAMLVELGREDLLAALRNGEDIGAWLEQDLRDLDSADMAG